MMLTTPDNTRKVLTTVLVLVLSSLACMEQVVTPTPTVSAVAPTPSLVPATPTRRAVPSATAEAQDVQTAVVRAALVNVRAEPGGEVVGQLEAGTDVRVIECIDGWCQIVDPDGWVFQGCLSIADGQGCEAR
jgi:uncharacterized protein YgiM (DUF1202 family)